MAQLVTAPTRRPRVAGIKSVVQITPEPRLAVAMETGGITWEDVGCGLPAETRAGCYATDTGLPPKSGDGPAQYGSILTEPFAQYKGVECWLGGEGSDGSYEEQARAVLEAGEERLLESRLWAWAWQAQANTAVNLQEAIGFLEDRADGLYVGQGIILMDRQDAEVASAAGVIEFKDGMLQTKLQTPVIAIGGSTVPRGRLALVGAIGIYASETRVALGRELRDNVALGLAERVYDMGVDCGFRIDVTVTPAP